MLQGEKREKRGRNSRGDLYKSYMDKHCLLHKNNNFTYIFFYLIDFQFKMKLKHFRLLRV